MIDILSVIESRDTLLNNMHVKDNIFEQLKVDLDRLLNSEGYAAFEVSENESHSYCILISNIKHLKNKTKI